jgi:dTDP-4-amino-4,6-dideoxygalactose transaminase
MLTAIPRYGARVLPNTQELIDAVDKDGHLLEGPHVRAFEIAFGERLGAHAVATSYGRMAFYYILKALDLRPGSQVVLPALTFWVMPEIARVAGFKPVFADVDPTTFTMTPETLARVIGPDTAAVVPTHLWGLPCDMDGIMDLARARGLHVVEDCAHALGATYRQRPVGMIGDSAFFSFQTLKPLNTYGGGMAVTRDASLADPVARLGRRAGDQRSPRQEETLAWPRAANQHPSACFTWTLFPTLGLGVLKTNPDVFLWEPIRPSIRCQRTIGGCASANRTRG